MIDLTVITRLHGTEYNSLEANLCLMKPDDTLLVKRQKDIHLSCDFSPYITGDDTAFIGRIVINWHPTGQQMDVGGLYPGWAGTETLNRVSFAWCTNDGQRIKSR